MSALYERGWHRTAKDWKRVWHGSPNAVYGDEDVKLTIAQARELAEMNGLAIDKVPIKAEMDNGDMVHLQSRFALMITAPWMDEPHFSGRLVGPRYNPMQLDEMSDRLEGLQKHWPLAGTMILRNGEIFIVQLAIDEFCVGNYDGERHFSFLTVANDLVQGGVIWLRTVIRAECWNTYNASLKSIAKLRIPHTDNADTILAFLAQVETATVAEQKRHQVDLDNLMARTITEAEVDAVLAKVFPDPKPTSKMKLAAAKAASKVDEETAADFMELVAKDEATSAWKKGRMEQLRNAVKAAYEVFNGDFPYAANTAYALFQAITQIVNHSPLFKGSNEKQQVSLLFGQKANIQDDAWDAVMELV